MSDYSDIQQELDDFENAAYGEEVRDSMISAIKKIHDTAESAAGAPDATTATAGQVLTADGNGGWAWGNVASKDDLSGVEDWLGYPTNLFDARNLTISNTNNWSIDSATKTSVTITHKTTYSSGMPIVTLDLPSGTYVFHADYTESDTAFSYRVDGTWVKALTDGAEFTIDSAKTNEIYFSNSTTGEYTITNISAVAKEQSGKVQTIEDNIDQLTEMTSAHDSAIGDLQDGLSDITTPKIESLTGTETSARAIRPTGEIYTAGSDHYKIVQYPVTGGKTYWISASTNYENLLWCFYDSSDNVVQTGTRSETGSANTNVSDVETIAPNGASYVVVAYNDGISTNTKADCKTQTGYSLGAQWMGKKWVCVGDSLTAENIRTTKHYFDYVAEETGITIVNMGVSGSGYARLADSNQAFYQRISSCPTDADVVTIFGSFNDLGAGLPIGTVNDTGTDTLAGCINTTINNLQAVIPLVNLGIIAPTPWDTTQPTTSGQAYNYVEMLKAICERRSIPFLDLWRSSNLRPWDTDFRELAYSKDDGSGTHPDENGHKLIAPRFKGFLETLFLENHPAGGGGGSSITVDSELSPTSTNPVQNKVIYEALQSGGGSVIVDSTLSDTSVNPVQNRIIKLALDEKASGTVSRSDSTRAIANSQFEVIDRITTNSAGQVTEVRTATVGIPTATATVAGLMSATDKTNLDTLMSDYQSASTALG